MYDHHHVTPADTTRAHQVASEDLAGSALSSDELAARARDLLPLYARAFMHADSAVAAHAEEFLEDLRQHLQAAERITILNCGDARALICGRAVSTPLGELYHLEGILVDPTLQGRGIGSLLLRTELLKTEAQFIAFHTQSRVMLGLAQKLADLDQSLQAELARYIPHRHLLGTVDEKRYGGKALYGDREHLNVIGIRGLDLEAGDALFVIGRVRRQIGKEGI